MSGTKTAPPPAPATEPKPRATTVLAYGGWWVDEEGKGSHLYWPMPEAWEGAPLPNREPLSIRLGSEKWRLFAKALAPVAVGCVFRIECAADDPGTVFRNSHTVLGYIPDATRVVWQAASQAALDARRQAGKVRKEKGRDLVTEALEPVRRAYHRCRGEEQRRALLVRVLRIVQGYGGR